MASLAILFIAFLCNVNQLLANKLDGFFRMRTFAAVFTWVFMTIALNAQNVNDLNPIEKQQDPLKLTYKKINGDTLKLTFRYPPDFKESKKYPCIIFFFGGGWNGGELSQFQPQAEYFAARGMITVLADYRVKSRHKTSPYEAVSDAKSAIRFLRMHAKERSINPRKIVASGGSAGGHIALGAAVLPSLDEPTEDLDISSKPNALVLFNPVLDNGPEGFCYERMGERYLEISPMHNIHKGAPPTVIFLGTEDHIIPVSNAQKFKDKMEAVGSRCELHLFDGQKHGFFNQKEDSHEYYSKTVHETDLFLISLKYLKGYTK